MDLELAGKRALVTGGSRGIGRAVAEVLAGEGCDVAILARDAEALSKAAVEIAASTGRTVLSVTADTTSRADMDAIPGRIASGIGPIDILVNAAAAPGGLAAGPLESVTDEAVLADLDTKFLGYLRCARALAPGMKQRGWGRLIHIAGTAARQGGSYSGGARNIAIAHLSKTLSDELGPFGITSNVVHPAETDTEWLQATFDTQARERIAARNAIRRIPTPREVAWVIAFLASPRSVTVTGEAICVGGGPLRGVTI